MPVPIDRRDHGRGSCWVCGVDARLLEGPPIELGHPLDEIVARHLVAARRRDAAVLRRRPRAQALVAIAKIMIERRFKDHGRHEDRLRLFRCSSDCPCGSAVVRWRPDVIEKEACHDAPLKRVAPDVGGPKRRSGEGEGAMGGAGSIGARGGGTDSAARIGTPLPVRDLLISIARAARSDSTGRP